MLFAGKRHLNDLHGGLSNERELVDACPEEFRFCSSWGNYVTLILFNGIPDLDWFSAWKWRTDDRHQQHKQRVYFLCLLASNGLTDEEKQEVGGWMLSEMLVEFPPVIWGKK